VLSAGEPIRPEALWLPGTYTVAVPVPRLLPQSRPPTALIE
jgi:hypothetical protein